MKRIVFFTRGGEGFGMGHLYRTWWIYQKLSEAQARDGALYQLEVRCVDSPAAWDFWGEREARVFWIPELEEEAHYLHAASEIEYPCTAVVDWLESPPAFIAALASRGARIALFDDYGPAQSKAQLVINALLSPLEEHTEYLDGARILSGVKYVALPPEATALRYTAQAAAQQLQPGVLRPRIASVDVFGILVNFGGAPLIKETLQALLALSACGFAGRVLVMPAHDELEGLDWQRMPEMFSHSAKPLCGLDVELLPAGEDFHGLLAASDMAILAGGLTLYEAAMLGVPAVCLALVEHQEESGRKLADAGCCLYAGRADEVTTDSLSAQLAGLIADRAQRSAMSGTGQKLVDGAGLSRVVEEILDLAGLLPRG